MRDYLDIGPTPVEEDCQQVGTKDYDPTEARNECKRYIELITKLFGEPPANARLKIKSNPHDFGTYLDVIVEYDTNDAESKAYAFSIENDQPQTWNDTRVRDWRKRIPEFEDDPED